MRYYTRLFWTDDNAGSAVRVDRCPDCGALVGDTDRHDAWHDAAEREQ